MLDAPIKMEYESKKFGKVIVYDDSTDDKYYTIEFVNTGYVTRTTIASLLDDGVRDRLSKNVAGVACLGYAVPTDDKKAYGIWSTMINRCYNKDFRDYRKYGEKGYTVCNRWKRFDYFLEDYRKYNRPEEYKTNFIIKQEILDSGIKEFSYDNCEFISDTYHPDPTIVYESQRSGKYQIIGRERGENGKLKYRVRFIQTGYEKLVFGSELKSNQITDPYYPKVCGVGYIGNASSVSYKREYGIWSAMIRRCYDENSSAFNRYGKCGVTVSEEWHSFENFLRDFKSMENYDKWKAHPGEYELDKDKNQLFYDKNNKEYSKETCCIIPAIENNNYRQIEHFDSTNNNYYGVYELDSGNFNAKYVINGTRVLVGTYTNEIAAANARDWWIKWHGLELLLNESLGVPYMPPEEWTQYRSRSKQMYHLVDKPKKQMYHLVDKSNKNNQDD